MAESAFTPSVFDRLLKDRIIWLGSEVRDENANEIAAKLLLLAAEDDQKDIFLYINSPGGSITAGMAIYDTMQVVPNDIVTVGIGMAAFLQLKAVDRKTTDVAQRPVHKAQSLLRQQGWQDAFEITLSVCRSLWQRFELGWRNTFDFGLLLPLSLASNEDETGQLTTLFDQLALGYGCFGNSSLSQRCPFGRDRRPRNRLGAIAAKRPGD